MGIISAYELIYNEDEHIFIKQLPILRLAWFQNQAPSRFVVFNLLCTIEKGFCGAAGFDPTAGKGLIFVL